MRQHELLAEEFSMHGYVVLARSGAESEAGVYGELKRERSVPKEGRCDYVWHFFTVREPLYIWIGVLKSLPRERKLWRGWKITKNVSW